MTSQAGAVVDVRQFYDQKYSGFEGLPGYSIEKNKVDTWMTVVSDRFPGLELSRVTCLDLGCGLGLKTCALSRYFEHTTGVDFSERAIRIASLLNHIPEKLEFIHSNAASSGIRAGFISAIGFSDFNISSIEELALRMTRIFEEMTLAGGILMVSTFSDFSGRSPSGWYMHTREEITQLLRLIGKSGFSVTYHPVAHSWKAFRRSDLFGKADLLRQFTGKKPVTYLILMKRDE